MKKRLLLACMLGATTFLQAQINSNPGTHNWSSTTAWAGGVVPTSTDEVNITSNSIITLDIPVSHDTSIHILNGGQLQSLLPANSLTVNGGDVTLAGFGAVLQFAGSGAPVPVSITDGHLINGGVFMSGDLLIDNSSGTGQSENNGDFMVMGNMTLDGTELFENNLGMNVNGLFDVAADCEYNNNQSATLHSVHNMGTFENAGSATLSDTLWNAADLLTSGSYMDIEGSIINTGDFVIEDSIHCNEDLTNSGTFTNYTVIHIANDFYNSGTITGDSSAFYLIGQNSENAAAGMIDGNIDICDTTLTGQYLDIMTGSADYNTVTFCSVSYASLDEQQSDLISVFPNPANEQITIAGVTSGNYVIYSADGRIVKSNTIIGPIDLSDFQSGAYIIKITSENRKFNTVFFKR